MSRQPPTPGSSPLPSEEAPIPFGRYELLELVGEGAMAEVYRARQSGPMGFSKEVALKRLRANTLKHDRRDVQALVNEARLGGQLRHPNLVEIYGCDVHEGSFFLAMEFVRGWLLGDVLWRVCCANRKLPVEATIDILRQLARGLAYAHEATDSSGEPLRLVHRDLKPHNIFLDRLGVVKIADFGLAKSTANLYRTTDADETKGSPLYMSPEQVGGSSLDSRSDLFALGSITAELLTGLPAFEGTSVANTLLRVLQVDCSEALSGVASTAPQLSPIVERLLAREPDERYQSARALLDDLDALSPDTAIGSHTRALVGALIGEDPPGLPRHIKAHYFELSEGLAKAGALAEDPAAHLRAEAGPSWTEPTGAESVQLDLQAPPLGEALAARRLQKRRKARVFPFILGFVTLVLVIVMAVMLHSGHGELDRAKLSVAPQAPPPVAAARSPEAAQRRGPAIHVAPASARQGTELLIRARILEPGQWSMQCYVRPAGSSEESWSRLDMPRAGDGTFQLALPLGPELAGGVEYFFELREGEQGQTVLQGTPTDPYRVPVL